VEKPKTIAVPDGVRQEIEALVSKFRDREKSYEDSGYQEESVRVEFINPFFKALGWDVENKANLPETLKPVVHIYSQRLARTTVRPDYAFRYGREKKFLLEAKKPAVDIFLEKKPAYQARIYSFNEKLPIAILTNFKQFAVYDYRITKERPSPEDKPEKGRREFFTFEQYLDNLEFLYSTFSYEAAKQLNFDLYVEEAPTKISREVDEDFLLNLESWRKTLAQDIAKKNLRLSVHEINFAVQVTIDRIIFLRMAEDRGIELPNQLQSLINGTNVYPRLLQVFYRCDDKYNSGLFDFKDDQISTKLKVDDKALAKIIDSLYGEDCPYLFSQWDADVLGSVYERFLGKVIHLTATHQARVEDKPEVKKAKGVYYTPKYIVEYIVKNTVDKRIEGKAPKEISQVKILDPACGSGSFLVQAYQHLLDYHLEWYAKNDPEKNEREGKILRGPDNATILTIKEKKKILLNNIFGVDIDPQAVEVTKLSLLLKVLENEDRETISYQQKLFYKERALPDLDNNIQCGNSLISRDFYINQQIDMFDEEQKYRVNAFDWEQVFKEFFEKGGFDIVIGNPPWGGDIDQYLPYFHNKYPDSTQEHTDSFKLFADQGIRLLSSKGMCAMIVPNTILRQPRLKDIRSLLMQYKILSLVDLGEKVFKGVVAPSCIFVVEKIKPMPNHRVYIASLAKVADSQKAEFLGHIAEIGESIDQATFESNPDMAFGPAAKKYSVPVVLLGNFTELECRDAGINYQRVGTGMQDKGKSDLADRLLYEGPRQKARDKMFWKGSDIDRYWIKEHTERFCRPQYSEFIRSNEVVVINEEVFRTCPKLLFRQTADHLIATIDYTGIWFGRSIIAILLRPRSPYKLEYFLGIMNSEYFGFLYRALSQEEGRVFAQVKLAKVKQLPIRIIDFSNPSEKQKHEEIVKLVESMFALHKKLSSSKTPDEKTRLDREIKAADQEIDGLVYELYGLTEEEIQIIEQNSGARPDS